MRLGVAGVVMAVAACAASPAAASELSVPKAAERQSLSLPVMPPWETAIDARGLPAAPIDVLKYYGGRVISNVNLVAVYWTGSVDSQRQQKLAQFYQAISASSYMDWLTEYDTIGLTGRADGQPGSNQHIGRGTFGGAKILTPTTATGQSLTTDQIAQELSAQITAGNLPQPQLDAAGNVNTLYMIDFPVGYRIQLLGVYSCQAFCAFHWTVSVGGKSVPFAVHPAIADCGGNCGSDFDAVTIIHSHEMMEAITDPEAGLANLQAGNARPLGWLGDGGASQEIGDLCWHQFQGDHGPVAGFMVQRAWSNFAGACVLGVPICDGSNGASCRSCNKYDSGAGCSDPKPACATSGPNAGKCVPCTGDYGKGCAGATPVCDAPTNTCVGCLKSGDCPPAAPVCDTSSKTCHGCASDADCGSGLFCDARSDAMKGQCVPCVVDSQCPSGSVCDPAHHTCVSSNESDGGGGADQSGLAGSGSGCGCAIVGGDGDAAWAIGVAMGLVASALRRKRG